VRRRLRERLLRRYFAVASRMGKGPHATPEPGFRLGTKRQILTIGAAGIRMRWGQL